MKYHPFNADKTQSHLVLFKVLTGLLFILVCAMGTFIALSDVTPLAQAPAFYAALQAFTIPDYPWYVWVYGISAIGAFATLAHELLVDGELLLNELIWGIAMVLIPGLNTWRIFGYLSTFIGGKTIVWSRRQHHPSQGW